MSSVKLAESTVSLIEAHLKAGIAAALADVRTDRADPTVTSEVPQQYLRYESAWGYRTPAIFTICESMRMRNAEQGANHVNALARVNVSVLVEDRNRELLVKKSWRYQAALFKLLHLTSLTSADSTVRLVSKVDAISFSPVYSDAKEPGDAPGVFRKEVMLELDVEHYENF